MAYFRIGAVAAVALWGALGLAAAEPAKYVTVVGTLTEEGAECQALRGRNGKLYTLAGDFAGFQPGDTVRVRGRVAEMSFCMQGTTIDVRSIKRLN